MRVTLAVPGPRVDHERFDCHCRLMAAVSFRGSADRDTACIKRDTDPESNT